MITFLLYTMVAWFANASFVKILHISIQPGQWLDSLLNYQKHLQQWDLKGKLFLSKAGGYCETCFSHLITFFCFWVYVVFMNTVVDVWITDGVDGVLWKGWSILFGIWCIYVLVAWLLCISSQNCFQNEHGGLC